MDFNSDFIYWVMQRVQGMTIALETEFTGGLTKAMRLFSILEKGMFTGSVLDWGTTWKHFY